MMFVQLAVFLVFQSIVLNFVNRTVPDDYMDEIFHGPQAREYCRGAFDSWHPKITTFPGIYYIGALYCWAGWLPVSLRRSKGSANEDFACSTPYLRSLNVLLSVACLACLGAVLAALRRRNSSCQPAPRPRQQRQNQSPGEPADANHSGVTTPLSSDVSPPNLHALALALYPLHWFFSFLYYTDVAALLFLLLCQLQAVKRRYKTAALAGAAAVLCRQTNAVWTAFILGESVLSEVGMDLAPAPAAVDRPPAVGAANRPAVTANGTPPGGLLTELRAALARCWQRRGQLTAALWPLVLPPAAFVGYVVANGGHVVLGDKEAHTPVRHGAQLLYFAAWVALMLWPQLLPGVPALGAAMRRRPVRAAVTAAAAVLAAAAVGRVSTMVHPYLLADNRHYVFYLWRRLLGRGGIAKYALAPVYALSWALLLAGLLRRVSRLWVLGFMACLAAQLLPAWLLELRYFTPGFYLIAMRLQPPTRLQTAAMLATFGGINAVTMYLFLKRPYTFADGSVARFMW